MAQERRRKKTAAHLPWNIAEPADQWHAGLHQDRRHDVLQAGRHRKDAEQKSA